MGRGVPKLRLELHQSVPFKREFIYAKGFTQPKNGQATHRKIIFGLTSSAVNIGRFIFH